MSFINGLKRAFGFSSDDDYDYDDELEIDDKDVKGVTESTKETGGAVLNAVQDKGAGYDELADDLFTRLIEIMNAPLPDMVRKCIDYEAQKRLMFNELGGSLRKFMDDSVARSMNECGLKWESEREALRKTISNLEAKNKECKLHAEETENKGLSAERQKRAITERCQEFEKRVTTLEAELEQLHLINKSLTNKVKVAQVKADDNEFYANEIERLKGEIMTLRNENAQPIDANNSAIEEQLNARIAEMEQVNSDLNAQLDELRDKFRSNVAELESVQQELVEANAGLEIVQEIQVQLDKVEEMKASKDAKIAELTHKCSDVEQQIVLLNATIKDNLVLASDREVKLRSEIELLKSKSVAGDAYIDIDNIGVSGDVASVEKRKDVKKKSRGKKEKMDSIAFEDSKVTKISAIDESLENLDWLVPSPKSEIKPSKIVEEVEEPEGNSQVEDNSLQMSLF